jgi:hypothetical protein
MKDTIFWDVALCRSCELNRHSSDTLVQFTRSTRRHISEDGIFHCLVWFQWDGATANTAINSMSMLCGTFPCCILSHSGDKTWLTCSSDSSACDFLWGGYLKNKAYTNHPQNILQLIISKIRFKQQVIYSVQICHGNSGVYLSDIIFKELHVPKKRKL